MVCIKKSHFRTFAPLTPSGITRTCSGGCCKLWCCSHSSNSSHVKILVKVLEPNSSSILQPLILRCRWQDWFRHGSSGVRCSGAMSKLGAQCRRAISFSSEDMFTCRLLGSCNQKSPLYVCAGLFWSDGRDADLECCTHSWRNQKRDGNGRWPRTRFVVSSSVNTCSGCMSLCVSCLALKTLLITLTQSIKPLLILQTKSVLLALHH